MKRGSTLSWLSVSALLLVLPSVERVVSARTAPMRDEAAKRRNELTLAGIRPGRDSLARVTKRIGNPVPWRRGEPATWIDACRQQKLSADVDSTATVQTLRVEHGVMQPTCEPAPLKTWRTGLGLRVGDSCSRTIELYGKPDSRSPSTKGGQPLELLYYAFDWAGPDVPQVLQVVCSAEKDGQTGRVVQITLAASSL